MSKYNLAGILLCKLPDLVESSCYWLLVYAYSVWPCSIWLVVRSMCGHSLFLHLYMCTITVSTLLTETALILFGLYFNYLTLYALLCHVQLCMMLTHMNHRGLFTKDKLSVCGGVGVCKRKRKKSHFFTPAQVFPLVY